MQTVGLIVSLVAIAGVLTLGAVTIDAMLIGPSTKEDEDVR